MVTATIMAPKTKDELQRSVFCTRIQKDPTKNGWDDYGALEVGVAKDPDGKLLDVVRRHSPVFTGTSGQLNLPRFYTVCSKAIFMILLMR